MGGMLQNTVVAVPGGIGMQAVALRLAGDKAMLYKVKVLGTQDTLLDDTGSHYFYQCHIQGSIDFIFGRARSLYQVFSFSFLFFFFQSVYAKNWKLCLRFLVLGSNLHVKQDCVLQSIAEKSGAIAAHHRDIPDDSSGFSFVNCVINGTGKIYLGRAWGNYSRIIYSYSYLEDIIYPTGWSDWNMPYRDRYKFHYKS